ncbi:OmpA family protein [Yeosuana sp. AK3]
MILKKSFLLAFLIANIFSAQSQTTEITKKDSTIVSSWIAGIGFNIVDDSDDVFHRLLDVNDAWNAVPYPSRLSIGRYFKNGLGIEAIASYNKYKKGKIVDGLPLESNKNYYAIDSRLSYDLNKIIGQTAWFDPYIGAGIGYTHANDISRGTYNAVLGFRAWFNDKIGLDVNSSGKWTMNPDLTNHLQHAIGLVYRFNAEKELSKKGKAKLELIEALAIETTKRNDSIALANKVAEENRLLTEQLEKEKEIARLAKLEKENQQALEQEKSEIQTKIDALETIYFTFDSSYLTQSSQIKLSKLILILNEYPKLLVEINSNTDSRGSASYNKNLSEKRLQSILDYLIKKGVETHRIVGKANGEEHLVNECDDHTTCSEIKHKQNRRSEIKIIKF